MCRDRQFEVAASLRPKPRVAPTRGAVATAEARRSKSRAMTLPRSARSSRGVGGNKHGVGAKDVVAWCRVRDGSGEEKARAEVELTWADLRKGLACYTGTFPPPDSAADKPASPNLLRTAPQTRFPTTYKPSCYKSLEDP